MGVNQMKNFVITLFVAIFSSAALAGPLTVTNTFSPNTTAKASEVNQNFTDVKSAVDDNDGRITTNASGISTNTGNITSNTSAISTNVSGISGNASAISTNSAAITTNGADIGTITTDIATNAGNISGNASNITANTNAISAIAAPLSVLANGTPVGRFIGFDHTYRGVNLINSKDYLLRIRTRYEGLRPEGGISNRYSIFYQSVDCTGPAYIQKVELVNSPPAGMLAANHGVVFDVNGSVYYLPANAISSNFSVSSYHSSNDLTFTCQPNPMTDDFYAVFPNDSLVTGVSSLIFPLPITLGQ
jgi:hypothetical protein